MDSEEAHEINDNCLPETRC